MNGGGDFTGGTVFKITPGGTLTTLNSFWVPSGLARRQPASWANPSSRRQLLWDN
jgi:uncharacterized repeat protein (TIGR03803 family)